MKEISKLNVTKLSEMLTSEFIDTLKNIETAYINSEISVELLRRGSVAIPEILKYLQSISEKIFTQCDEFDIDNIKKGWIMLYVDIAYSGKRPLFLTNFDELLKIADGHAHTQSG